MELPIALKAEIEARCAGYKQAVLAEAAQALSERYRNESGQGKRLLTKDIETLAYAAVRMPATYGAVIDRLRALEQLQLLAAENGTDVEAFLMALQGETADDEV